VSPEIALLIMLYLGLVSLAATVKAIMDRDLVKAIAYSAIQSIAYAIIYALLLAPDILIVYLAVGAGIYPVLMLYAVSKTRRYEEDGSE